jgi:hypothetical protein
MACKLEMSSLLANASAEKNIGRVDDLLFLQVDYLHRNNRTHFHRKIFSLRKLCPWFFSIDDLAIEEFSTVKRILLVSGILTRILNHRSATANA